MVCGGPRQQNAGKKALIRIRMIPHLFKVRFLYLRRTTPPTSANKVNNRAITQATSTRKATTAEAPKSGVAKIMVVSPFDRQPIF
jgi:hypothetical protein